MERLTGEIIPAKPAALQDCATRPVVAAHHSKPRDALRREGRRSAVTGDFFSRPASPANDHRGRSRSLSLLPVLAALASLLLIAIASLFGLPGLAPPIGPDPDANRFSHANSMNEPGPASGFRVSDISMQRMLRGSSASLVVNATISNKGGAAIRIPAVRVSILSRDGQRVQHWSHVTGMASLEPGARIRIRTSAIDASSGEAHIATIEPMTHE